MSSPEGAPAPELKLDIPTIHELRRRVMAHIFAREVEIIHSHAPDFSIEQPEKEEELIEGAMELDRMRKLYRDERLMRDGEFKALWNISDLLDEFENEAIKQHELEDDVDIS